MISSLYIYLYRGMHLLHITKYLIYKNNYTHKLYTVFIGSPYGACRYEEGDIMVDLSRRSMLTGSWRSASNGILPP